MISNTNRTFGNKNGVPQDYLFVLGWLFGLVNGGTRVFWGLLMDKFGFKILMFVITIIEIGIAGSIYFLVKYPIIYVIENALIACCISGTFTTITPLFNKIFGKSYGAEMYGLTGFFVGLASFCGPILIKIMIPKEGANPSKDDPGIKNYLYLYITGGGICAIKIIVLIFFNENEKYIFSSKITPLDIPDIDEKPITRPTTDIDINN